MITDPDLYFAQGCGRCLRFATPDCSALRWQAGLATLRQIAKDAGLVETAKWGHPCYMHAGRNIAIIGAFRADFRLSFFNAALLQDPDGLLEKQGPNTRHADCLRFTDPAAPAQRAPLIRAYMAEAMAHAEAGMLPAKEPSAEPHDQTLPEELANALDHDPKLAEAFHALTPGRQRSYVILLAGAKTAATRIKRVEKARPRILAGKGATEL